MDTSIGTQEIISGNDELLQHDFGYFGFGIVFILTKLWRLANAGEDKLIMLGGLVKGRK